MLMYMHHGLDDVSVTENFDKCCGKTCMKLSCIFSEDADVHASWNS